MKFVRKFVDNTLVRLEFELTPPGELKQFESVTTRPPPLYIFIYIFLINVVLGIGCSIV